MSTADERPPLHLPHRPSKRRRDLPDRHSIADARAHAPARQAENDYATLRRGLRFRGPLAILGTVFRVAEAWASKPESLEMLWAYHRGSASYYQNAAVLHWLGPLRYLWGVIDTAMAAAIYGLGIATRTFPRVLLLAGLAWLVFVAHPWG